MSYTQPVERVVELLESGNYRPLKNPIEIGTLSFEFAEVMAGTDTLFDLIVIADTTVESNETRLRRKVEALARALDMVESRRPLSLVLVGPSLSDITFRELSRICRVLQPGTPTGADAERELRDVLAVLLPLEVAAGGAASIHPLADVRARLPATLGSGAEALIEAAPNGPRPVEEALRLWLEASLPEDVE